MPTNDGGLGNHLVGDKITVSQRNFTITKLLGEGGFSYVYLIKEHDGSILDAARSSGDGGSGRQAGSEKSLLVLKVTSIHSRAQRDIAEKEAKLLSRLSHPSIVKMYDTCYQSIAHVGGVMSKRSKDGTSSGGGSSGSKERPQHLILMEFCEGGHALDVCNKLASAGQRFDLSTLIIAFGQICNAVSYLHAQRPPIVHRDLKPVNFLVKNGAYKLCDFGSAVFGHVDLKTQRARAEAEEVIQKTTTQMFRAPEMVDLYMAKKLTQSTDVWALGCCLYSLAFLQNCFEEGSNLAILSRKYTIPEDNPYGDGLVELLDRMLTVDSKARADMTEVILCLSAVYSGRPLPPRKRKTKPTEKSGEEGAGAGEEKNEKKTERVGTYRTDGQGVQEVVYDPTKVTESKKLASNSVAARRKRAAMGSIASKTPAAVSSSVTSATASGATTEPIGFSSFGSDFGGAVGAETSKSGDKIDFASGDNLFGEIQGFEVEGDVNTDDFFGSFEESNGQKASNANDAFEAAFDTAAWVDQSGGSSDQAEAPASQPLPVPASTSAEEMGVEVSALPNEERKRHDPVTDQQRNDRARRRRPPGVPRASKTAVEIGMENMSLEASSSEAKEPATSPSGQPPRPSPEKKDNRVRRSKTDDDSSRKRSNSWAKRRGRGRSGDKSDSDGTGEGSSKSPSRATSIRNLFGRGTTKSSAES